MAGRKKATKTPAVPSRSAPARVSRGRTHPGGASFPVAPPRSELPRGYAKALGQIKQRIQQERLRVVLAANSAMAAGGSREAGRRDLLALRLVRRSGSKGGSGSEGGKELGCGG